MFAENKDEKAGKHYFIISLMSLEVFQEVIPANTQR